MAQNKIVFTHLDKLIYPKQPLTKKDVIAYYSRIAPYLLPFIKNRMIVMQRFPQGISQEGFFQKEASSSFPAWLKTKKIPLKKGGFQSLVVIKTTRDIIFLANQNVLVFHGWMSIASNPTIPDRMVFDIDPDNNPLPELHLIAKAIKQELEKYHLISYIMTTGSRGYHVIVPIKPKYDFDIVHAFAKKIAQHVAQQYPTICTASAVKTNRKGKIFIDYLRNSYGQTSVTPYSLRPLEHAPIATPIAWHELAKTSPQKYTIKNIFKRLSRKKNSWDTFFAAQRLSL